jgi:hypothetical protein
MAETKKGKKWEGSGQPTGQGGTAKKEKEEGEVGGRGRIMMIEGACGHALWVDSSWNWAQCPIDGVVTYAW